MKVFNQQQRGPLPVHKKYRQFLLGIVLILVLFSGTSQALFAAGPAQMGGGDIIIYAANAYYRNDIYEINLTQNTFQYVDDLAFGSQAIAEDPETGYLYYYEWRADANEFGYWNPATQTNTRVRFYSPAPGIYAKRLDFAPDGTLYLMDDYEHLYTVNKNNGNLTLLGAVTGLETGALGGTGDFAFAPDGTLYVATYRSLYTVDLNTMTATLLYTNMLNIPNQGIVVWTGLAYCNGMLYGSHAEQNSQLSAIFSINPATGEETLLFYLPTFINDLSSCPVSTPPTNTPPVANNQSVSVNENGSVAITLTASDADNDPLTFNTVSGPANGSLSGTAPNLTYSPNPGFSGTDSFTFRANDGTADSNIATVSIPVNNVNTAPVANNDPASTNEDTPIIINVLLNDTDADEDALTVAAVSQGSNGDVTNNGANVTYMPNFNFCGSDSFSYQISDGNGGVDTATVTVIVVCLNDAPMAVNDNFNVTQNNSLVIAAPGVLANDSDVENDSLLAVMQTSPSHGNVTFNANGSFTYQPNAGFSGADSFSYVANDGIANSNIATISIFVSNVNTSPVANNQNVSVNENGSVAITLTASDADNDPLTFNVVSGPANGSLSGTAPNLTYSPNPGFSGTDSFTFRANDGTADSNLATVSITVNNVNTAPVANNQSVSVNENGSVAITLTASDADNDPLTFNVVSGLANGSLSGTAPNLTYSPNPGFSGTDSFTFRANDGTADSNLATVSITVNNVNTAPVANNQSVSVNENGSVAITLTASDADNDPLTFNVVSGPANGSLSGTAPNLTYSPNPGFSGTDSFTFRANDGTADSNLATVSITVNNVNTAPVANNQSVSVNENGSVAITLTLTASDADNDPLTFNIVSGPANGSLSGTAPNLTYSPNPGFSGADSFTFRANDGTTDSNLATVSITVNPVQGTDVIIYGANGYNFNDMIEINLTQNTSQQVGDISFGTQAIAQDPETGYVYYYEWQTTANEFGYWNPQTQTNTRVRLYSPTLGLYIHRMDFAPDGTLYLMDMQNRLFTINKNNGNITLLGQVSGIESGQFGGIGDMAFAPDGTLYVVLYRSLYSLNLQTMSATLLYSNMIDVQNQGIVLWSGLAYCNGLLYASDIEQNSGLSAIYSIDPATGDENHLFYLQTIVNDLSSCPTSN